MYWYAGIPEKVELKHTHMHTKKLILDRASTLGYLLVAAEVHF